MSYFFVKEEREREREEKIKRAECDGFSRKLKNHTACLSQSSWCDSSHIIINKKRKLTAAIQSLNSTTDVITVYDSHNLRS